MVEEGGHRPAHEPEVPSAVEESSGQAASQQDAEPDDSIPEELLAQVPIEHQQAISHAFMQVAAPASNPIVEQVTPEHVSRIIDNLENESVRGHDAGGSRRKYQFAYFALGIGVAVGLIVFFTVSDNRDLIAPIVTGVAGFLGGLAAGQRFRS